jgi:formylglycine-generating enzyme required for sulfatase activity
VPPSRNYSNYDSKLLKPSKPTFSKMSSEIYKGLPRRAAGAGLARQNADNPYVCRADFAEEAVRPLEPVAAVTYAQAREYAEAAEKARLGLPPAPAMSDVGKPVTDWKKKTD